MRATRHLLASLIRRHCNKRAVNVRWYNNALVFSKFGAPEDILELQQLDVPAVGEDDVKVKMLAAPINPSDINSIQGTYPLSPQLPAVGGNEMVGMVTEIGARVTSVRPGDHVIAAGPGLGTWRQTLVCHNDKVLPVPTSLPVHVAATLMVNPATAYRMMRDFVELKQGDTIVQNGANSGVGQAVIQLAAHRNINTINIIRNRVDIDDMKEYLIELGATEVISEEQNSKRDVTSLYQRYGPVMLGLNTVGGDSATNIVRHLSEQAVLVTYGGMSKQPVKLPTGSLIFKDVKFVGYWNAKWIERNKNSDKYKQMYDDLIRLGLEGKLKPPKCTPHTLSNYRDAVREAMKPFVGAKQLFVFDQ